MAARSLPGKFVVPHVFLATSDWVSVEKWHHVLAAVMQNEADNTAFEPEYPEQSSRCLSASYSR